jgi:hypothetical protein
LPDQQLLIPATRDTQADESNSTCHADSWVNPYPQPTCDTQLTAAAAAERTASSSSTNQEHLTYIKERKKISKPVHTNNLLRSAALHGKELLRNHTAAAACSPASAASYNGMRTCQMLLLLLRRPV